MLETKRSVFSPEKSKNSDRSHRENHLAEERKREEKKKIEESLHKGTLETAKASLDKAATKHGFSSKNNALDLLKSGGHLGQDTIENLKVAAEMGNLDLETRAALEEAIREQQESQRPRESAKPIKKKK